MSRSFAAALCAAVVSVFTSSTFALNYDEAVDGNFPFTTGALTTLTLDPGVNTVKGNVRFSISTGDSFAFVVPAGMTLTSGTIDLVDNSGDFLYESWNVYKGSATYGSGTFLENVQVNSPGSGSLTSAPLVADTYNFTTFSTNGTNIGTDNANYTFTLTVVPEPSALSLIGIASCGLLFRKRR